MLDDICDDAFRHGNVHVGHLLSKLEDQGPSGRIEIRRDGRFLADVYV